VSSAQPVSPAPAVLPFGPLLGLFDQPGCPACRHLAEATEEYLTWLALEGCRGADVLSRLCASRGLCPAHSRGLLTETGAIPWIVLAYRDAIEAAVADVAARPAPCPACEHASSAADRLFGYLLGDATRGDRRTYKQHGGLCLPHLRLAAVARRGADILWLVRFMIVRLTAPSPSLDLLAGHAGAATPLAPPDPSGEDLAMCAVCAAAAEAARSERDGTAADCLCPLHLRSMVMAAGSRATDVLAGQAALHAARLSQVVDGRARSLGNYLSVRARRALADPDCPVCRRSVAASMQAIAHVVGALRQSASASPASLDLCLRHARDLSAVDQDAGRIAQAHLSHRGRRLLRQLTAVAEIEVAGHRTGSGQSAMTAVRRAAVFLDGSAFAAGPSASTSGYGPEREVRLRYTQRRRGSP
jgi:hypothetical protein